MIHYMDITKTAKSDEGTVRCIARNHLGEAESKAQLRINAKPDFRNVLKNAKNNALLNQSTEPAKPIEGWFANTFLADLSYVFQIRCFLLGHKVLTVVP